LKREWVSAAAFSMFSEIIGETARTAALMAAHCEWFAYGNDFLNDRP